MSKRLVMAEELVKKPEIAKALAENPEAALRLLAELVELGAPMHLAEAEEDPADQHWVQIKDLMNLETGEGAAEARRRLSHARAHARKEDHDD